MRASSIPWLLALCCAPVLMGSQCQDPVNRDPFFYTPPEPIPPATPGVEFYFRADGTEGSRGNIEPGNGAELHYDLERMNTCDIEDPNFRALAFVRSSGSTGPSGWVEYPLTVTVQDFVYPLTPVIPIGGDSEMQFAFFGENQETGCKVDDPQQGQHYRFPVTLRQRHARISFGPTGGPTVTGLLEPGSAVTVDYPIERLSQCRGERKGSPTWRVELDYTANQIKGTVGLTAVAQDTTGYLPDLVFQTPAGFTLPPSATVLEMRFKSSDHTGCLEQDPPTEPGYLLDIQ